MASETASSALPITSPDCGTLYLGAPSVEITRLLQESFRRANLTCAEPYAGVLAVPFSASQIGGLGQALSGKLGEIDRKRTRCRIVRCGQTPTPAELMQTESLADLLAWIEGQWLSDLLENKRLVTFFQPIVRCENPTDVFAYECLTRGKQADGQLIPPDRLYAAARATNRLNDLDQAARLMAIQTSAHWSLPTNIFININPRAIYDPLECVELILQAALDSGIGTNRFVFEVVESDGIDDSEMLLTILDYYREAGFRVALDDLGAGYSSLNLLATVKPDFVKLDMGLIQDVDRDPYRSQVASKLLELARDLNVKTVVEGVETESQWEWSRDHGADFAQGYLFARPAARPPQVAFTPSPESQLVSPSQLA